MPDRYEELYRELSLERSRALQHGARLLRELGRRTAARFALYWEDESGAMAAYTFWDLQQAANRLSNALAALGVKRGDRVAHHPAAAPGDRDRLHRGVPDGRDRAAAVAPLRPRRARVPHGARRGFGRDRRAGHHRQPVGDPRPAHAPAACDRRRRRERSRGHCTGKTCSPSASSAFDGAGYQCRRSGADHLHQRHHRPAQGRAARRIAC